MARPYKIYERLLAEKERPNTGSQRKKRVAIRGQKDIAKINVEQRNGEVNLDFERRLMYKKELARETGVPLAVIKDLIADGFLQVIKFPGSRGEKYSPTQLADLIRQYNKLPWAWHPICKLRTHS